MGIGFVGAAPRSAAPATSARREARALRMPQTISVSSPRPVARRRPVASLSASAAMSKSPPASRQLLDDGLRARCRGARRRPSDGAAPPTAAARASPLDARAARPRARGRWRSRRHTRAAPRSASRGAGELGARQRIVASLEPAAEQLQPLAQIAPAWTRRLGLELAPALAEAGHLADQLVGRRARGRRFAPDCHHRVAIGDARRGRAACRARSRRAIAAAARARAARSTAPRDDRPTTRRSTKPPVAPAISVGHAVGQRSQHVGQRERPPDERRGHRPDASRPASPTMRDRPGEPTGRRPPIATASDRVTYPAPASSHLQPRPAPTRSQSTPTPGWSAEPPRHRRQAPSTRPPGTPGRNIPATAAAPAARSPARPNRATYRDH